MKLNPTVPSARFPAPLYWRKARVNVHPRLFPRSKDCNYRFVRSDLLVLVGGSELRVGDLKY